MKRTLTEHLAQLSPYIVYMLGRKELAGRPVRISQKDIATSTGLSLGTVQRICNRHAWDQLTISTADKFARACRHDLLRPRRNLQYLMWFIKTGRGFAHLTNGEKARFAATLKRRYL